ncbi:MAG: glycosyltransferase [Bacteroidia bacterium]|nr:glycosyltransferase [Bacteroidia bacterium]
MSKGEKILFCVLNWGLGHATRSEPLIRRLLSEGKEVHLASDGNALLYLRERFPDLVFYEYPSYNIRYGRSGTGTVLKLALQMLPALRVQKLEQQLTEALCKQQGFTHVYSDGRFGAFSRRVPSVYITHQLCPGTGSSFVNSLAARMHARIMNRFTEVWVPDHAEEAQSLAGALSRPNRWLRSTVIYIGPLSRFESIETQPLVYDALAVLSGPEPQRSLLEEKLLQQMAALPQYSFCLLRGVKGLPALQPANVYLYEMAGPEELQKVAARSALFICRSGYSGIMDLHAMGIRKAVLVPTPGQGEQMYLARYLDGKKGWQVRTQEEFSLRSLLPEKDGRTF